MFQSLIGRAQTLRKLGRRETSQLQAKHSVLDKIPSPQLQQFLPEKKCRHPPGVFALPEVDDTARHLHWFA